MRTSNDIKAIKAAELIKQYCKETDCPECIFHYYNECILFNGDDFDNHDYVPYNWHIDLIKED